MEYVSEAVLLILAVIFPLSCVLFFLKALIRNLGDTSTVTEVPKEEKE
ncbi:hypothetical protein ACIGHG_09620 [Bacillus sp. NPDC077411]|uniref:Uncharacterized protein n=1 Tax=Bacillus bruguierae TaxID=3127667 RepID=A0ABU8FI76_9BACI|nr:MULTISPECIES: hypothetical protein [unclassified Bacillus (in: firmicutes)]SFI04844.1 hypothetical protein SAMN04488574_101398 [Bacillus sp. 71mf]SFS79931.1 hypothetical protein SAMN04488145_103379 [Bacillus sp. 103mf]